MLLLAAPLAAQEPAAVQDPEVRWAELYAPIASPLAPAAVASRLPSSASSQPRTIEPAWAGTADRPRRFLLRGVAGGALAGLVAYIAVDGLGCFDEPEPGSGISETRDANDRLGCVFSTHLPLYVGGGAVAGGLAGVIIEQVTR